MTAATKTDALLKQEIDAGAWVTPGGDPVVELVDADEGDCAYCGEMIYGQHAVTRSGMTQAVPGRALVWRWFGREFEAWHEDCLRWIMHWVQERDGATLHLEGCRYASKSVDARRFQLTRGEARVILDAPFCKSCAPIEFWVGSDVIVADCPTCDGTGTVSA